MSLATDADSQDVAHWPSLPLASQQLRQPYQTTWRELLTGELIGVKTRHGWRVDPASLRAAVERKCVATAGAA